MGLPRFRPRPPWWGPDLQTLRDTIRPQRLPTWPSEPVLVSLGGGDQLLARLDRPGEGQPRALGLVLLLPGLGGDSEGIGLRRLAQALCRAGFAVLRLNLRGAGAGRPLARGTYAARCDSDLLPVIAVCGELAHRLGAPGAPLPLIGVGLSLGGTMLLNLAHGRPQAPPPLAALVAVSSPLDLDPVCRRIEHSRNALYQQWMVRRLLRQALADPHGLSPEERQRLAPDGRGPRTLRQFDTRLTAPRWGWPSVEAYYAGASPLPWLLRGGLSIPTLLVHALDDPWVPAAGHLTLAGSLPAAQRLTLVLPAQGGHNGFHSPEGCWSDAVVVTWLTRQLAERGMGGVLGGSDDAAAASR